jgi:hypothetical protein
VPFWLQKTAGLGLEEGGGGDGCVLGEGGGSCLGGGGEGDLMTGGGGDLGAEDGGGGEGGAGVASHGTFSGQSQVWSASLNRRPAPHWLRERSVPKHEKKFCSRQEQGESAEGE